VLYRDGISVDHPLYLPWTDASCVESSLLPCIFSRTSFLQPLGILIEKVVCPRFLFPFDYCHHRCHRNQGRRKNIRDKSFQQQGVKNSLGRVVWLYKTLGQRLASKYLFPIGT
jgi:hypothetical protein